MVIPSTTRSFYSDLFPIYSLLISSFLMFFLF